MNNRFFSSVTLGLTLLCSLSSCMSRLAPSPGERPGLGTAWGEDRESRVRPVAFERGDPAHPAAVASLHYDDQQGLRALTGGRAWRDTGACNEGSTVNGPLGVRVLDEQGAPLPQHCRSGRHLVLGHRGQRYTIEIENRRAGRVEAVATVDGLDVLDGGPGSFAKRGYLIESWSTLRVEGFRRNMDEVAAFRFGSVADSYAAQKGQENNVGVIAVAIFPERGWSPPSREREAERRRRADPFPGRFATPPSPDHSGP